MDQFVSIGSCEKPLENDTGCFVFLKLIFFFDLKGTGQSLLSTVPL